MYILNGSLYDDNDVEVTATNISYLNFGAKSLLLRFYGSTAKGHRHLRNLTLYDERGLLIDHVDQACVTDSYDNMEHESPQAKLTGELTDNGTDINGDVFFDFLTVNVGIDVQAPGEYSLTGTLCSLKGEELIWSIAHKNMSSGSQNIVLDFKGKTIWTMALMANISLKIYYYLEEIGRSAIWH